MARKDLLKSLMDPQPAQQPAPKPGQQTGQQSGQQSGQLSGQQSGPGDTAGAEPPTPREAAPRPKYTRGAIGAVGKSIADLKSRAIEDVHPDQIDPGGLEDRLEEDRAAHEALMTSLRDYGQQVPVLLRHDPNAEGRYQIVYGRRRVAALRELGQPVKAMIRDLNDRELIIAQGQENAARKDLSFIEKANFARQMRDEGFERRIICDALHIDKTVISRMLTVADALPLELIRAVGPAPNIGRDRWLALCKALDEGVTPVDELAELARGLTGQDSDARFETVLKAAKSAPAPRPRRTPTTPLTGAGGAQIGEVRKTAKSLTLKVSERDFAEWLVAHMDRIHRDYKQDRGE